MALSFFRRVSVFSTAFLLAGAAQGKSAAPARPADSGCITAKFSGLQGRTGYLRVSVFGSPESFPDGAPLARRDISLRATGTKASPLTVTFAGLRPGVYAVCAFHDRDGNGKLTQDFFGIPQEEWGMSGNPRPQGRAPRFDEARISLNARQAKTIFITLHT